MMSNKLLIRLLFPVTFVVFFVFGLYVTFPGQALNASIAKLIASSFFSKASASLGQPAEVTIGHVSLWRMSGVELSKVTIKEPTGPNNLESIWNVDSLKVRIGLLSLLTSNRKIVFDSDFYGANLEGSLWLSKDNQLSAASLYVDGLDIKQVPKLREKIPVSQAILSLDTEMDFGANPSQDGKGYMDLKLQGVEVFGVKPGNLVLSINFEKGQGKSTPIKLVSEDVNGEASLGLELARDLMASRLEGNGWFKFTPEFEKKNSILVSNLSPRKDATGQYPFRIYGSLSSPIASWGALRTRTFDRNNPLRNFEQ